MVYNPRKDSLRYLHRFLHLKCAPELIRLNIFPNVKEITESFAAYHAVVNRLKIPAKDGDFTAIVVGDGTTPRTAALLAYMTKWNVVSIDPKMSNRPWEALIRRLKVFRSKVEETKLNYNEKCVLVLVHSHATLEESLSIIDKPFRSTVPIVSIPCCVPHDMENRAVLEEYEDSGILSPHRTVKIW